MSTFDLKVYKEFKLSRDGDGYNINHRTLNKPHVTIDEGMADKFNSNTQDSGLFYELDVEASKELAQHVNQRRADKIKKSNRTSFDPPLQQHEQINSPEPPAGLSPDQEKYNKRKEKMIVAGWEFNTDMSEFIREEQKVSADELLSMPNAKYGKLLK